MKKDIKLGLALSGGGMKGLAHIGVIKVLERHNIPIDYIAGTSAGALIGGVYASGTEIEKIEKVALKTSYKELVKLLDPARITSALIKGEKIKQFIRRNLSQEEIKDFKIPFAGVATDLFSGRKVVLDKGSALTAIRASISLPGVFRPVIYKKMCLVDGGIVEPLPARVVKDMGADVVVAVDVIGRPGLDKKYRYCPQKLNAIDTLRASLKLLEREVISWTFDKISDKKVVIIEPRVANVGLSRDFQKTAERLIKKGETAAKEKIDDISRLLK